MDVNELNDAGPNGPAGVNRTVQAPRYTALVGGLIIVTALWFLWSGALEIGEMLSALGQDELLLNLGPVWLVLGFGLLARKRWARRLALVVCVATLAFLPILAVMAGNRSVNVSYVLPQQFEHLAGPPAIILVSIVIGGLALVPYVALMSRAGKYWFGLPPGRGEGVRLWRLPVVAWAGLALLASVWLAGQRQIVPIARFGGVISGASVDGQRLYVAVGMGLGVLDLADPDRPSLLGQTNDLLEHARWPRSHSRVLSSGSRAYVMTIGEGLIRTFDTSDPGKPQLDTETELEFYPADMAFAGDQLVVVGKLPGERDEGALAVLDANGWISPWTTMGRYQHAGYVAVAADEGHAYAVSRGGECCTACPGTTEKTSCSTLHVFGAPSGPMNELGSAVFPANAVDLALVGDYVYVLAGDGQLIVLDLRTPSQPTSAGWHQLAEDPSTTTPTSFNELVIVGDTLATLDWDHGQLVTVDISRPAAARVVGRLDGVQLTGMASGGERLYAVDGASRSRYRAETSTLAVVDIADGRVPRRSGSWTGLRPSRIVLTERGDYALTAEDRVHRLDLSDPAAPRDLGPVGSPDIADAAGDGSNLFAVTKGGAFGWLPEAGQVATTLQLSPPSGDHQWRLLEVSNGVAYLAKGGNAVTLVDVSDPALPALHGAIDLGASPRAIAAHRDRVYVAVVPAYSRRSRSYSSRSGVQVEQVVVFDVAVPSRPRRTGAITSWQPLNSYVDLAIADGRLYLAETDGVRTFSLADPDRPKRERTLPDSRGFHLAVGDDWLYTRTGSIKLHDVTGLFHGRKLDELPSVWGGPLAARGPYLFTVDQDLGLGIMRTVGYWVAPPLSPSPPSN